MTEFYRELRKILFKNIFLSFSAVQLFVALIVALLYRISAIRSPLFYLLFFLGLEMIVFGFILSRLTGILEKKRGNQEVLSRILFSKTRNVINNISHEWRTPLNAIMGFADQLYEMEKDENKKEALRAVQSNSERLYSMSKKLIDFSSIETGLYKLDKEYQSIDSLILNLESKYRKILDENALQLTIENSVSENLKLYFDYNALFEILDMLVENAIKFTEKGTISLKAHYDKSHLTFVVTDSGIGIPDNIKKQIFEVYQQGSSELDREYEGIGLGLTIVKKLVEMHKGKIQLDDNSPNGSIFTIIIKTSYMEKPGNKVHHLHGETLPRNMNEEQKEMLQKTAKQLERYIKVFDSGKIQDIARDLYETDAKFKNMSTQLIEAAKNFDEKSVDDLVKKMLEVEDK